jgi:ABC-2 type transport system ATP-binding protein
VRELILDRVTKRYGSFTAVDQVSMSAQSGRILGVLGPNGAGKTTSIRMITHITAPDEGTITLEGKPVGSWAQRRLGYLPEERGLYKKMTVFDQLIYFAQLKGLDKRTASTRVNHWLDRFEISDWKQKKAGELSKGMQQKIQFIGTIIHEPDLVVLDEPFSGLDPINADLLLSVILELRSDNRIILFASHRMEQVEELCDDIALIAKGKIRIAGAVGAVKQQFASNYVRIRYRGSNTALQELASAGKITLAVDNDGYAEFEVAEASSFAPLAAHIASAVDDLFLFERSTPPLRDIFKHVVAEAA